jgi:hypothetical protein
MRKLRFRVKLLKKLERFVGICINSGKRLEKIVIRVGGGGGRGGSK